MDKRPFSVKERVSRLEEMAAAPLDVLVIGGGITGAGIALDAASRGLRVGLLEKQDFGAGTSSRSTKLIHGGLRYLKQGEIKLVQEVGRERTILYRNAPHIVIPEPMLLPLVKGGTYGRLATSFGLWLYDRLAGVTRKERRVMLSRGKTLQAEPLLRGDILKGGGLYIEYRTDDARLTIETMKTADQYGALCVNYAEATSFVYEDGIAVGIEAADLLGGGSYRIMARKIVNAAGPWGDLLREKDHSLTGKRLHLTKGVHLVVAQDKFPLRQAVYFDVPDGRMIFAIPRGGSTYIGTTDTDYAGSLEKPRVTREEVRYLLDAANAMFPSLRLAEGDVTSSWAGLRPLIHEDGKSPSELSRKDEIFVSPSGLITIAGGKLTGFRKMAERVVDLAGRQLEQETGRSIGGCITDRIVLSGGGFDSPESVPQAIKELTPLAVSAGLGEREVQRLVGKYGVNAGLILERAKAAVPGPGKGLAAADRLLLAEAHYAIHAEMAATIGDFFIRRTGMLLFDRPAIGKALTPVLEAFAAELGWDGEQRTRNREQFDEEYEAAVTFR
ncbi:glycerol-3-phosphate dehydrogenase/oxidase [Paenibacillus humicola]|uniref:glycerol-3-phosphate dehydrogenase/oxidase n=1 Tax=Paenibacillus humicola TaxID=3110540 RepID=UPI00237A09D8|nr:glycerol-3-phosphate dehydrogenase/oxidase [Paenibacillus humicola]